MHKFMPGDQAYVCQHAYMQALETNESGWLSNMEPAIVISTSVQVTEEDDAVTGKVTILIPDKGLFKIDESYLMTPEEYADPSRLFPRQRLREP